MGCAWLSGLGAKGLPGSLGLELKGRVGVASSLCILPSWQVYMQGGQMLCGVAEVVVLAGAPGHGASMGQPFIKAVSNILNGPSQGNSPWRRAF